MTTDSTLRQDIDKAFVTAFLLSGNAARAEAAVLRGIEVLDSGHGEELLQNTLKAAIRPEALSGPVLESPEQALSRLPMELQRVMRLPRFLRQCFVLRVLAGLPIELCAGLLNSNGHQVDQAACAAMRELPAIREKSFATHFGWDGSNKLSPGEKLVPEGE